MIDWLATHTVFIAAIGAAILEAGGSRELGSDRGRTTRMVLAVRDGFHALARHGVRVTPAPLRIIFVRVPRLISVPYWQSSCVAIWGGSRLRRTSWRRGTRTFAGWPPTRASSPETLLA